MLTDHDILEILANQRVDIPVNIVGTFARDNDPAALNRGIFRSRLLPIPSSLTFFEPWPDLPGEYGLSSFFKIPDPDYSIVPFGGLNDMGISYNTFEGQSPLQSYTVCTEYDQIKKRGYDQAKFFEETNMNAKMWSAGHLIAHRYTPEFSDIKRAATIQYKYNFIPEPHYWNCYQRNHLEDRCVGGFYGVYPIYNLRYSHGRTVKPYGKKEKRLPYRPIPDGEFFIGSKTNQDEFRLYMPFIEPAHKVYASKAITTQKCKLDFTVQKHKVNSSAFPMHFAIDFSQDLNIILTHLNIRRSIDQNLSAAQQNIFLENFTNPLHQAALIQRERAATLEINSPQNKMRSAMFFSSLQNDKKTRLYLRSGAQHAKLLLDKCEAEEPAKKIITDRLLKEFKASFPDENQMIDVLERLKFKYN